MRSVWRVIQRSVFWSYERGTWPYDVAVAVIVIFVLLSPRSWFHDRPPVGPAPGAGMVQLQKDDPAGSSATYRVDARLLSAGMHPPESELEHQLHEALSKNASGLHRNDFEIVRIEPIRGDDGTVAYYDVSVKP